MTRKEGKKVREEWKREKAVRCKERARKHQKNRALGRESNSHTVIGQALLPFMRSDDRKSTEILIFKLPFQQICLKISSREGMDGTCRGWHSWHFRRPVRPT